MPEVKPLANILICCKMILWMTRRQEIIKYGSQCVDMNKRNKLYHLTRFYGKMKKNGV